MDRRHDHGPRSTPQSQNESDDRVLDAKRHQHAPRVRRQFHHTRHVLDGKQSCRVDCEVGTARLVMSGKLFAIMALLAFPRQIFPQDNVNPTQCNAVTITIKLRADENFQRRINDLAFKMQRLSSTGWVFSLEDAKGRDFIYPANPALRFNSSQTLGAGYGDTAKQSLSRGRELRFLLSDLDYEAFQPYVTNALWPYNAPDPEHAIGQYLDALDKLRTGLLHLSVIRSDISRDDVVQSAEFGLE